MIFNIFVCMSFFNISMLGLVSGFDLIDFFGGGGGWVELVEQINLITQKN